MVNGQYVTRGIFFDDDNDTDNDDLFIDKNTRGGVIEGAVGFFKPIDTRKRMIFDVYAGYGNGAFKTLDGNFNSTEPGTSPVGYTLRTQLLRSLKKAAYRASPDGHFGLNKKDYTHFTSPIRRYSDLVVHRVLE